LETALCLNSYLGKIADGNAQHGQHPAADEKHAGSEIQWVLSKGDDFMSLGTILLIVIVIALLGGFSGLGGGPFYGTGYYGGGGLGLVLVIVLILVLLGKL
jgi:hypothetical protein